MNAVVGRYANACQLYQDVMTVIPNEATWYHRLYEIAFSLWICLLAVEVRVSASLLSIDTDDGG
jgi:hypothetical protein